MTPTRAQEAHRRAVRAYQDKHRKEGLCILCPEKAETTLYCTKHREKARIHQQRRSMNKRQEGGRTVTCALCNQSGHNRRSCADRQRTAME